jgi:hypothetical protein
MLTLCNILPYSLHDALKLLGGCDNTTGDEFQLGTERISELLHSCGISIYALNSLRRIWMLPYEIVFSSAGMEQARKPIGKLCSRLE